MPALLLAAALATTIPAFPGAEGAGAAALGGRGGVVLRVTNLDDSGPGSLRAAVETAGPRTIIFDIGGTITLKSPLTVRQGRLTLAGQTAPGGGITLRGQPFRIHADDVVVRYLRVRLGDEQGIESDAFEITGGRRIMVDHVSASWSVDESLSIGSTYKQVADGPYDITVQWSIIAQSLNRSLHGKGQHGYGTLLRCSHGAKISFHHNLWAHHMARMPRPGNTQMPPVDSIGPFYQFQSNVFYNWGGTASGYNADQGRKASMVSYDFIDNSYIPGPNSQGKLAFEEANPNASLYFAGNSMEGTVPVDPWSLVQAPVGTRRDAPLPDLPLLTQDPAATALPRVLASAGASLVRDRIDEQVVTSVTQGTGTLIDSQTQAGGWPDLARGQPWTDSDGDGMPDAWETARRLNPQDHRDGPLIGADGYSNLEQWLNGLVPPL
ncbi:pectate lyase family protein [Niveispirillum lacus]|uniref:pectate lyase family protein n=1 Tax=Niveispirillum lacus TaxID=1981099 RepID=UPI001A9C309D|nr:hypothetical protein [Niveispirillum lacus]